MGLATSQYHRQQHPHYSYNIHPSFLPSASLHTVLYNWRRDLPNKKDRYSFRHDSVDAVESGDPPQDASPLPSRIDHRKSLPGIYQQDGLGSSTVQALRVLLEHHCFDEIGEEELSALFMYYTARDEDGTLPCDAGVSFRTALRSLHKYGGCFEDEWPYVVGSYLERPPCTAYTTAWHPSVHGERVPHELEALKYHLANGYLVAFGTTVYDSFDSLNTIRTGQVKMPETDTEDHYGGHAMVLVGYDDHDDHFIVRNSWGSKWGDSGYSYIPYAYVIDSELCSDFWILVKDKIDYSNMVDKIDEVPKVNDTTDDDTTTTDDDTATTGSYKFKDEEL